MKNTEHSPFDSFKLVTTEQFHQFKDYLMETKFLLEIKQNDFEKSIELMKLRLYGHRDVPTIDFIYWNERIKYSRGFPTLFFHSSFMISYSLFETSFNQLCLFAIKDMKTNFRPTDLSGGNIVGRCKTYLEKVFEVDLSSSLKEQWLLIAKYQQVRNWLVHDNSERKMNSDLKVFLKKNDHIHFQENDKDSFYILGSEFIEVFCKLAMSYLFDVVNILEAKSG